MHIPCAKGNILTITLLAQNKINSFTQPSVRLTQAKFCECSQMQANQQFSDECCNLAKTKPINCLTTFDTIDQFITMLGTV